MSSNKPADPAAKGRKPRAAPAIERAADTVLAVASAIAQAPLDGELEGIAQEAASRGYLTPDEEDRLRVRYKQYLASRAALAGVLATMEPIAGRDAESWSLRRPAFVVALAAAVLILGQTRAWTKLALGCRPLRKALDAADARHGLPRKTFTRAWRSGTGLRRLAQLDRALSFHRAQAARGDEAPPIPELLALIEREAAALRSPVADRWRDRLAYRWFSFRRRHHSAWKQAVFGLFRWSGSLIADLRQPWVRPAGSPKSIDESLRRRALDLAQPGDVFITRHQDALSNLFLPGFWPHAALFLGDEAQRQELGLRLPDDHSRLPRHTVRFLEARKDGVRFRAAEDTLAVDAFVILRPPLEPALIRTALTRAAGHAGKPYDFVFDFRHSERLACTEVVYRGFHGCGPLSFRLTDTGGRLCLPAEELIHQSLAQGFRIVACAGVTEAELLTGTRAELALHASRCGI